MIKMCSKCGEQKDISEFNKKGKGRIQSICRQCTRLYAKKHYNNNKQYYVDKSEKAKEQVRKFLEDYKKDKKCSQCGEKHPACLEFHHQDVLKKDFTIGDALRMGLSIEKIKKEIIKCIILCSNCHRKKHYKDKLARRQTGKVTCL